MQQSLSIASEYYAQSFFRFAAFCSLSPSEQKTLCYSFFFRSILRSFQASHLKYLQKYKLSLLIGLFLFFTLFSRKTSKIHSAQVNY